MSNLRTFCLELLESTECPLDCYRNDKWNHAYQDVLTVVAEGRLNLQGFTPEEVAKELQLIGDEQPFDHPLTGYDCPVNEEWYNGIDAGHWGVCDLYEDAESGLKALLESGQPFNTGWFGNKHNTDSARITADKFHIFVEAGISVDSLEDYAIIFDACKTQEEAESLTDDDLKYLVEAIEDGTAYSEFTEGSFVKLPRNATYVEVMDTVAFVRDEANEIINEFFDEIKEIVIDFFKYKKNMEETENACD